MDGPEGKEKKIKHSNDPVTIKRVHGGGSEDGNTSQVRTRSGDGFRPSLLRPIREAAVSPRTQLLVVRALLASQLPPSYVTSPTKLYTPGTPGWLSG